MQVEKVTSAFEPVELRVRIESQQELDSLGEFISHRVHEGLVIGHRLNDGQVNLMTSIVRILRDKC